MIFRYVIKTTYLLKNNTFIHKTNLLLASNVNISLYRTFCYKNYAHMIVRIINQIYVENILL